MSQTRSFISTLVPVGEVGDITNVFHHVRYQIATAASPLGVDLE